MATPTYLPLATLTLTSAASTVTFSSIPQGYRDLILVVDGAITGSQSNTYAYLNGDTAQSNYSYVRMLGDGSATSSAAVSNASIGDMTSGKNNMIIQIMDYSATDKHKTRLSRSSQPSSTAIAYASRWANTAAVTSISLAHNGSIFAAGSTFSLFGI